MALPVPNKQLLILAGVIIVSLVFYIWLNWEQDISVAGQARAPGCRRSNPSLAASKRQLTTACKYWRTVHEHRGPKPRVTVPCRHRRHLIR